MRAEQTRLNTIFQSQIKIHIKKKKIIINEKLNDNSFTKSKLPEVC